VDVADPPTSVIASAARAVSAIPYGDAPPLYARVDGCIVNGELLLMELEVLEPELFLRCAPESAGRLADALLARIG
jgi:hypothetical protein